jgi:hypothetical protein
VVSDGYWQASARDPCDAWSDEFGTFLISADSTSPFAPSIKCIFLSDGGAVGLVDSYNLDKVSREGSTNDKALST